MTTKTKTYYIVHDYGKRISIEIKLVRVFSFCEFIACIDTGRFGVIGNSRSFTKRAEALAALKSLLLEGFSNLWLQANKGIYEYNYTPPTIPIPQVDSIVDQFFNERGPIVSVSGPLQLPSSIC